MIQAISTPISTLDGETPLVSRGPHGLPYLPLNLVLLLERHALGLALLLDHPSCWAKHGA